MKGERGRPGWEGGMVKDPSGAIMVGSDDLWVRVGESGEPLMCSGEDTWRGR